MALPAALLAEALAEAGDEHDGFLGVRLAHLVPPVVLPGLGEVDAAPLHLAPRPDAARRGATSSTAAPPRRRRGHRVGTRAHMRSHGNSSVQSQEHETTPAGCHGRQKRLAS
uniref:Uncharacterized protein n=1 Tax=Oryza brachyantha TaxID=4533 RepID=J3ML61_ORYBR